MGLNLGFLKQAIQKIAHSNPAADLSAAVRTVDQVEAGAIALHAALSTLPDGREKSLALTKLEEAILWGQQAVVVAHTVQAVAGVVLPPAPAGNGAAAA